VVFVLEVVVVMGALGGAAIAFFGA